MKNGEENNGKAFQLEWGLCGCGVSEFVGRYAEIKEILEPGIVFLLIPQP